MSADIEMSNSPEMKDSDSEQSSSSEDESLDDDTVDNERITELQNQIAANVYMYDPHVELIKLLRQSGELEELRKARERMADAFPLTEELWLPWLQDEAKLISDDVDRVRVCHLFERAVKDYLGVGIWLEYVQFSLGAISKPDGISEIRDVFNRALTAVGLHVTKGSALWDAYREFEMVVLAGLQPDPGTIPTPLQSSDIEAQVMRLEHLFKRQLSVPLLHMEVTLEELKEFSEKGIDDNIKWIYEKSYKKLQEVIPYEENLESSASPHRSEYLDYIQYEEKGGDPARIQCLYERMIEDNCLDTELWLQYTDYLDSKLKMDSLVLSVYERSVRNCSWADLLWVGYIRALERYKQPHEKVTEVFQQALDIGYNDWKQYLTLWQTYIDYLRRRIDWEKDCTSEVELLKDALDKAVALMKKMSGDPECTLLQYWARLEAMYLNNMTAARELWTEILQHGHGSKANVWMEYYRLERSYGDEKHCRKLLQRAINSVTDFPEIVVDTYTNFERDTGTLESYEQAVHKCASQIRRIEERKLAKAEKEAQRPTGKNKQQQRKTPQQQQKQQQHKQPKQQFVRESSHRADQPSIRNAPTSHSQVQIFKRQTLQPTNTKKDDGFKVPAPPPSAPTPTTTSKPSPSTDANRKKSAPPPGFKGKSAPPPGYKGPPPPGYKGALPKREAEVEMDTEGGEEQPASKRHKLSDEEMSKLLSQVKEDQEEHMDSTSTEMSDALSGSHDTSRYPRTVFVSNLDYGLQEETLRTVFSKIGEITEIRMVKNYNNKFKGFGYVEFNDELSVGKALDLDRTPINGRPMFVSCCKDIKAERNQFKFSTDIEKNKLFVRNLPLVTDEAALNALFSQHGDLQAVRLVTFRNGASKGLAYIEYKTEEDAANALEKTNGLQMGDKTLDVAISKPPARQQPQHSLVQPKKPTPAAGGGTNKPHTTQPTLMQPRSTALGAGNKQAGPRGRSKTQVTLMPRSVQKTQQQTEETKNGDSKPQTSTKMSNDDFRNMLLKK